MAILCKTNNWAELAANAVIRYLVVDLMSGGDLRFHISRKTFTEDAVRFWIAELGCALRYVHSQNIIHRDVKPDNVLLDADGHVHLTDFVRPPQLGPR
jgi:serine/threonine kinase 32